MGTLKQTNLAILLLIASMVITLLTSWYERPVLQYYGNMGGPQWGSEGGLPMPYLRDDWATSVNFQLGFFEDIFSPLPFLIDVTIYFVLLASLTHFMQHRKHFGSRRL